MPNPRTNTDPYTNGVLGDAETFPITEQTVAAARRTVAANSTSATDCADLLMALGIHPSQDDDSAPMVTATGRLQGNAPPPRRQGRIRPAERRFGPVDR